MVQAYTPLDSRMLQGQELVFGVKGHSSPVSQFSVCRLPKPTVAEINGVLLIVYTLVVLRLLVSKLISCEVEIDLCTPTHPPTLYL